ncbi:MAG: hypothetical protein WCL51_03305 [Bacteroidota bacterium]
MSSDIIGKRIVNSLDKEIHLISDFRNTDVKSVVICDAIILDYTDKEGCISFLKNIRSSFIESIYLIPVFILSYDDISDPLIITLCDAVVSSIIESEIQATLIKIKDIKDKFEPAGLNITEERIVAKILRYMYSRDMILKPLVNKNSLIGYEYPILSLHFSDIDIKKMITLLSDLCALEYLEKKFVDKLHLCTNCFSSFINFRETCPECGGYNLTNENKIHHFVCKYEGKEREFKKDEGLRCPKCKLELKNNGVDFGISSVVYHCLECKHQFTEPVISAFCFSCEKINQIDKLIETNIYSYQLMGKEIITTKQPVEVEEEKPRQTHYGFITYSTFETFLKYEIERVKRNQKYGSIGKLELVLPEAQKIKLEIRYDKLLSEIADFLKNTTLPTDILTITPNNIFLIISPENSMTKLDFLLSNIQMSIQKLLSTNFNDYDISLNVRSNIIDGTQSHDELINDIVL